MSQIIAANVLANGLRTEFEDTYLAIRNRQADSRLGLVMDLGIAATNRKHEFAYFNAAPHMAYWRRGDPIPQDAMDSVYFEVPVYTWGRRLAWHKEDRKDDQTQSLMDSARQAGESVGLSPERMFFDLLGNTTNFLPAVPNAPDGAAFFATADGASADRFGVTNGNLLSGNGITTIADVQADYYEAIEQFGQFQDGKGQPLLSPETIGSGVIIIHAIEDTQVFEQAFLQVRQGQILDATGVRVGAGLGGTGVNATAETNIVQDASRNVQLWGTPRLATGDWYVFLRNAPKKATFVLNRESVQEFTSLEGDNNSDQTRLTGEESIQWEERSGAGIALPFGAIKINN